MKECLQSVSHSGPSDAHCVYLLLSLVEMRSGVTAAHLLSALRQRGMTRKSNTMMKAFRDEKVCASTEKWHWLGRRRESQ